MFHASSVIVWLGSDLPLDYPTPTKSSQRS